MVMLLDLVISIILEETLVKDQLWKFLCFFSYCLTMVIQHFYRQIFFDVIGLPFITVFLTEQWSVIRPSLEEYLKTTPKIIIQLCLGNTEPFPELFQFLLIYLSLSIIMISLVEFGRWGIKLKQD